MARTLVIESDQILLDQYASRLGREYDVTAALTAQQAIDALDAATERFKLIVLDVQLGKNNGVELLHEIRSYDDWIDIPVVLVSSIPKHRLPLDKLRGYGVVETLYKPETAPVDLVRAAQRVVPA